MRVVLLESRRVSVCSSCASGKRFKLGTVSVSFTFSWLALCCVYLVVQFLKRGVRLSTYTLLVQRDSLAKVRTPARIYCQRPANVG